MFHQDMDGNIHIETNEGKGRRKNCWYVSAVC